MGRKTGQRTFSSSFSSVNRSFFFVSQNTLKTPSNPLLSQNFAPSQFSLSFFFYNKTQFTRTNQLVDMAPIEIQNESSQSNKTKAPFVDLEKRSQANYSNNTI